MTPLPRASGNTTTFRVVLTGGIASGKTAVANAFIALGVPVIDTDQIARDVVAPGTRGLTQLVTEFGKDILDATGQMDRRVMRELVFAEPEQRKKLEAITHPAIRAELARRSLLADGPYQIHAIPLFTEGGARGNYNRILVVDCPETLQLQRLMQRDSVDSIQAQRVLDVQAKREQRLAVADDVIVNNGSLAELRAAVGALHEKYLLLADRSRASG